VHAAQPTVPDAKQIMLGVIDGYLSLARRGKHHLSAEPRRLTRYASRCSRASPHSSSPVGSLPGYSRFVLSIQCVERARHDHERKVPKQQWHFRLLTLLFARRRLPIPAWRGGQPGCEQEFLSALNCPPSKRTAPQVFDARSQCRVG
jgi:hypothetical protein